MKNTRLLGKRTVSFVTLSVLLTSLPAYAAALPNSGTALEGAKPPANQQQKINNSPAITIENQQPSSPADGQQKIQVNGFRFSGELPVSEQELNKLISEKSGRELTLSQMNQLVDQVTQYLREQGYLVAFAYLPAQDIKDGIVDIAVVPGKYGEIKVTGKAHISPERVKAMLFAEKPGAVITRQSLERALLLLNDTNGISVKANLTPGKAVGTADLVLEMKDTKKLDGTFYLDNWGNRYSGQTRSGVEITVNNASGIGDSVNVGGLLTNSSRMNDYNVGYSAPLGYDGLNLSVSHSRVHYVLGEDYANLGAAGEAVTDNMNLTYPIIRSREFNLTGNVGYDHKRLQDDITTQGSYSHRKSNLWNTGLAGSFSDNWLGGGFNSFSLVRYQGSLTIEDGATAANDAKTTNTAGIFTKTTFSFQRQQYVAENVNFLLLFNGQLASKNLDSSEKFYLGGADGVRAYSQGEAGGDQGYRVSGEFRWRLPGESEGRNNFYLTSFYDYGSVMVNHTAYSGAGVNRRSLMGAGLGVLWTRDSDFAIRMDYAWKIGKDAISDDTKNGRLWLQGVKYF